MKILIPLISLCLFSSVSWSNCIGDCVNGQGTYTWPDGDKYVGQFKDDKRNGQGTLTLADGSKKTGIWQEGVYFGTIVEWERAEKERITAEKMRQRAKQEADEKAEKKRIAAEKTRRRLKQEADDEYGRIYNACLLDKGASVDMQVSSLERALRNVCKVIAKDPSWLENMKYD